MGLEYYKEIVATTAAISTVGQMLAGTLICKDIYQQKSSKNIDSMPFIGGIIMSILMFQYALILQDFAMMNVNVCGLVLNVFYLAFYYTYSSEKSYIWSSLAIAAAFVAVFLGYAQIEDESKVEFRFGVIVTFLMFILIAAPLVHLGEIIKTKNTEVLSFPLIFMSTIVTFQWFLYGLIVDNGFIINTVGFIISATELSLFAIFPSKPAKVTSEKDQKKRN